jgi:hypothetical protein
MWKIGKNWCRIEMLGITSLRKPKPIKSCKRNRRRYVNCAHLLKMLYRIVGRETSVHGPYVSNTLGSD